MAEADLSPTTFTSRSASDPDYDISTEDSSENENENTYTEASSDNSSSNPEIESSAKTEVHRSSAMPKTKAKPIWLDQVVDVIPYNWSNNWKQFSPNLKKLHIAKTYLYIE